MPIIKFNECPCSGKNMSTLVAPWILLTLHNHEGTHGYEIQKMVLDKLSDLDLGLNISGVYRHLKMLEKRGLLTSDWDTSGPGPAKRKYFLTESGRDCLQHWLKTLRVQMTLIGKFVDEASRVFPFVVLPEADSTPSPSQSPAA